MAQSVPKHITTPMGIQSELHTLALRTHCFQREASPGTGSYTWLDRIAEFLQYMKVLND